MNIAITGTFQNITRCALKDTIEESEYEYSDIVNESTVMLIYGENSGSKLAKAISMGINVVSENQYINKGL